MAALQCEICGGKLIGKSGGIFECDSCGMEYDRTRIQEMVQEIKGTVKIEGPVEVTGTVKVEGGGPSAESLIKRGWLALSDRDWEKAGELFDSALNISPENGEAYAGKFCAEIQQSDLDTIGLRITSVDRVKNNGNYQKAVRFGNDALQIKLNKCLDAVKERQADRESRESAQRAVWREKVVLTAGLISAGAAHTVGLRLDGTAVAVGGEDIVGRRNTGGQFRISRNFGQCNVSGWQNLVAITAGMYRTFGLKSDGTVVTTSSGLQEVVNWRNIVKVTAGAAHVVGLKADGTVVATSDADKAQCDVSYWTDIVEVAAGWYHTIGLKADGTVVAAGTNDKGRCSVHSWTDIVAVAAGENHTLGLKSDGTVVAVGSNEVGQCNVSHWRNVVAVAAGELHSVGLLADGTVIATGADRADQCHVYHWTDIVSVAAGEAHTVGLKSDGTVVAMGTNTENLCNVQDWRLFHDLDSITPEREKARANAEAQRQQRHAALEKEKASIQAELPNIKGLFSGGKRRELEARLAQIEKELSAL